MVWANGITRTCGAVVGRADDNGHAIHRGNENARTWIDVPIISRISHKRLKIRSLIRMSNTYSDTAVLVELPNQPDRLVQMLLSVIVSNTNFTEELNAAIIECFAKNTSIATSEWGLFNATRFTPSLLQAEYFAMVSEEESLLFPRMSNEYIQSGLLRDCVVEKKATISSTFSIEGGRSPLAHKSASIVSSSGRTPGWVAGAAIGALAVVALIGLVVTSVTKRQVYDVSEYENSAMEVERHAGDEEMAVDIEGMNEELLRELGTIAGQGGVPLALER